MEMKKGVVIILALVAIATILCVPVSAGKPTSAVRYYTAGITQTGTPMIMTTCRNTDPINEGSFDVKIYGFNPEGGGAWTEYNPMDPMAIGGPYPRMTINMPTAGITWWFAEIDVSSDKIFCSVCWNTRGSDTTGIYPCYLPGDFYVANI